MIVLYEYFIKCKFVFRSFERPLLFESSVIVIFYVIFLMRYAVIIIILEKKIIPIKRKQGVNSCLKPLISYVFSKENKWNVF